MKSKSEEWWSLSEAIEFVDRAVGKRGAIPIPYATLDVLEALKQGVITSQRQGKNKNKIAPELWYGAEILGDGTAKLQDGVGARLWRPNRYGIDVLASEVRAYVHSRQPKAATGRRGRPSSWHLVEEELRRRWAEGERHSNREWARVLCGWLSTSHPSAAPLGTKGIENRIGEIIKELKTA